MLEKSNYQHNKKIGEPYKIINGHARHKCSQMRFGLCSFSKVGSGVIAVYNLMILLNRAALLSDTARELEAAQMLRLLSGRDHQVMTGVTVMADDRVQSFTEVTDIHFRDLSDQEINAYVATGEPMDKAGAYGIQGGAALFCTRLVGDYYNVMGLPVCRLGMVLREMAPELMGDML